MRIVSRKKLRDFWQQPGHEDAEQPLGTWYHHVKRAVWRGPADVKAFASTASFVGDRVVFNIRGNKYRLVALIHYPRRVYVRWIGTHADYDRLDVSGV